jgi:uncharacterized protein YecT (DUF1311 family)
MTITKAGLLAALLLLVGWAGAGAQGVDPPDEPPCDQNSTVEIVECLAGRIAAWDRRLNAAYRKAVDAMAGGQRDKLRAAQRLWIQYRDANCAVYAAGEGSIRRIEAALCMRNMTAWRALEFEQFGGN